MCVLPVGACLASAGGFHAPRMTVAASYLQRPPEQDYEGLREETGAKTDGAAHAHDETQRKATCRTFNALTTIPYASPQKAPGGDYRRF